MDNAQPDYAKKELPPLPAVTNIRRYRYRPGDRIVVRVNYRLGDYEGDRVQEIVAMRLGIPDPRDVLVLDSGSDIKVLRNTAEEPQ